jgi:hypothetical protein
MSRIFWMALILGIGWNPTAAQQHFSEGVLHYRITLLQSGHPTPSKTGTYRITLKGSQVRRDLIIDSASQTTVLCNNRTGGATMLQIRSGKKYAIPFSPAAWQVRNAAYQNYQLEPIRSGAKNEPAGSCQPYRVRYPDGREARLCVGTQPLADAQVFERFPDIKTIPVAFDVFMRSGVQVHFELQQAAVQPVSETVFEVPSGYILLDPTALSTAEDP